MNKRMAMEWLKAAKDDLLLIEEILNNEMLTHMVAFHAHQSLEKTLKAMIEYRDEKVPRQHDLLLLKEKAGLESSLLQNEEILEALNELYIESRYPGSLGLLPGGKPTKEEAETFYLYAKTLFENVNANIV
jgi:HEPN domain-containing protein